MKIKIYIIWNFRIDISVPVLSLILKESLPIPFLPPLSLSLPPLSVPVPFHPTPPLCLCVWLFTWICMLVGLGDVNFIMWHEFSEKKQNNCGTKKLMTDVHMGWSLENRGKSTQRKWRQGVLKPAESGKANSSLGFTVWFVCLFWTLNKWDYSGPVGWFIWGACDCCWVWRHKGEGSEVCILLLKTIQEHALEEREKQPNT